MSLHERVRPGIEAAPWVCDEIKKLEDRLAELEAAAGAHTGASVKLPSRAEAQRPLSRYHVGHAEGWNAAIDAVTSLNPPVPQAEFEKMNASAGDGTISLQHSRLFELSRSIVARTRAEQNEQKAKQEREAFEALMVEHAGPGAVALWIKGNPASGYANERVNDYRFGWVACLEYMGVSPAEPNQETQRG